MSWRRKEKATGPVCGCEHHLSYHDPETGACHGQVYIKGSRWEDGTSKYRQCTCRKYVGPEPLPEYYVPEITELGSERWVPRTRLSCYRSNFLVYSQVEWG